MRPGITLCPRCWNRRRPCDKCESTGFIPDVRLSKNFLLSEFVRSSTAMEYGIPNDPSVRLVDRLVEGCTKLYQPMRDDLGRLDVSSGLRLPALNSHPDVGGSPTSAHVEARAADFKPRECSLIDVMRWFQKTNLKFDQAILEPSWVHVGYKHPTSGAQRRQILVKKVVNGKVKYLPWEG